MNKNKRKQNKLENFMENLSEKDKRWIYQVGMQQAIRNKHKLRE